MFDGCYTMRQTIFSMETFKIFSNLAFISNEGMLKINKGSRAVNYILGCSSRNTSRTRTIYTTCERPYFSSSYDITFLLVRLK